MSKARDISNLFSASTDVATDAEVTAVLASHSSSLTNRHYKYGNLSSRPGSPTSGELYFNIEKKAFEVWTGDAWVSVAVNGAVPLAPTIGTATVSGLTASVPFTGPSDFGDAAITSYTATSNPDGITGSNASSPISVSGLSANTSYTFTVTATNSYGTSNASSASNSITTGNVPGAPTSITVSDPGTDGYALVSWTAPASDGGSAITDYAVQYSSNSGSSWTTFSDGTSTSTSATVTGLTLDTAYIFRAAAINAVGTGSYSTASSSFTPVAHDSGALIPLQVITVGSAGASSVSFTNIPSTYTHLQIRVFAKSTRSAGPDLFDLRFNGDTTTSYKDHVIKADGVSVSPDTNATGNSMYIQRLASDSVAADIFSPFIIDILDYKNTNKYKTVRYLSGFDANGSGQICFGSGLWMNNAAITSIQFPQNSYSTAFKQFSQFALYGVKSA